MFVWSSWWGRQETFQGSRRCKTQGRKMILDQSSMGKGRVRGSGDGLQLGATAVEREKGREGWEGGEEGWTGGLKKVGSQKSATTHEGAR